MNLNILVLSVLLALSSPVYSLTDIDYLVSSSSFDETLKLANQGDLEALYEIGNMYEFGHETPVNKSEAIKWYLKAANRGHASAQYEVGNFYSQGKGGLPESTSDAAKWFLKAANQGHLKSQRRMGFFYSRGFGVTKNYKKSYIWYLIYEVNEVNAGSSWSDGVIKELTPEEIIEAQNEATELYNKIKQRKKM